MRQTILPIVEGQSEVQAVPVLLRRLLERLGRTEPKLAARMDLERALQRCASFRRLVFALERILLESGQGSVNR